MSHYEPKCMSCKHFHVDDEQIPKCDAFPKSKKVYDSYFNTELLWAIPKEIWSGKVNHDKPYPGDHGIMYEPIVNANQILNR